MGKDIGIERKNVSNEIENNRKYFNSELEKGLYDKGKSEFFENGGYVLYHNGHNNSDEENECAKIMASKGYKIELTPEDNIKFASERGKFRDGKFMNFKYEQKTSSPVIDDMNEVAYRAIRHARDKDAEISVIYDNKNIFTSSNIKNGIALFERRSNFRFKGILVVNRNNVYEWYHNK